MVFNDKRANDRKEWLKNVYNRKNYLNTNINVIEEENKNNEEQKTEEPKKRGRKRKVIEE